MTPLDLLRRIAEVEFTSIVDQTSLLGTKLRILLRDTSYVDVWVSRKLQGRFGFLWERRHLDGQVFRYDNFPDVQWASVPTFPYHFHDGTQNNVVASPFPTSLEDGFRAFMTFVQQRIGDPS